MATGKAQASSVFQSIKNRAKGAFKESQKKEVKVKGGALPGGINRGVARLLSYKAAITDDQRKVPYISLNCAAFEPEEVHGIKFSFTTYFEESKDPKTGEVFKTLQDKTDDFCNTLKLIGGEECLDDFDMDKDIEKALTSVCEEQPFFFYRSWLPEKRKTDRKEPRVQVFPLGTIPDYEAAQDETVEEDEATEETEETEEETEEEAPQARNGQAPRRQGKPKPAPEPEPEAEVDDEGDDEPNPEYLYGWKINGKGKVVDIEIVKNYPAKKTCDLKIVSTGALHKGVKWSDLTDAT